VIENGGTDEMTLLSSLSHFVAAPVENQFGAFLDAGFDPV
jgi:hypothetical protein